MNGYDNRMTSYNFVLGKTLLSIYQHSHWPLCLLTGSRWGYI